MGLLDYFAAFALVAVGFALGRFVNPEGWGALKRGAGRVDKDEIEARLNQNDLREEWGR